MTPYQVLKGRILNLEEHILEAFNKNKGFPKEGKDLLERYKLLKGQLQNFGKNIAIFEFLISLETPLGKDSNLSKRQEFTVYYAGVKREEADELLKRDFPSVTVKSCTVFLTGKKNLINS